jgi:hypothetical protein
VKVNAACAVALFSVSAAQNDNSKASSKRQPCRFRP